MAEGKKLKVTYVRSKIGYNKNQAKILEALGFTKLNQTKISTLPIHICFLFNTLINIFGMKNIQANYFAIIFRNASV